MTRRAATPEAVVLAQCLQLLRLRGIFAWRSSNHAVARVDRATGRRFMAFHGMRGVADILFVAPPGGRLGACEVKAPGGRLSEHQKMFLDAVRAAGGLALVVRDPRELDAALRAEGVCGGP